MKNSIYFFCLLAFFSCVKKTDVEQVKAKLASSFRCPDGIGALAGDSPKMQVATKNGWHLILCGYSTESEFEIYSVDSKGIISTALVSYDANDYVRSTEIPNGVKIEELVVIGNDMGKPWPAFEQKIECTDSCKVSGSVCMYKKPDLKVVFNAEEIKAFQVGKNKQFVPEEAILAKASDAALTGDKKAQDFFLNQKKTIKLDAASAELFEATEKILRKMLKAKCL